MSGAVEGGRRGKHEVEHAEGYELFARFKRVDLQTSHRSAGDVPFATYLAAFRNFTDDAAQLRRELYDALVPLTSTALRDPAWQASPIIATDRESCRLFNRLRATIFAKEKGEPIITWRLPLPGGVDPALAAAADALYGRVKELTATFVKGAPVIITENIAVDKGLCNGRAAFGGPCFRRCLRDEGLIRQVAKKIPAI
jgi:hypothetical protein